MNEDMPQVTDYFFAPFVTPHERRRRVFIEAGGLEHSNQIVPRDPMPEQPVTVHCHTKSSDCIESVAVYYTTDSSEPQGEYGTSANGAVVAAQIVGIEQDLETGIELTCWEAVIPAQVDGTWVYYRIDAWKTDEPNKHIFADSIDPLGHAPDHGRLFSYHVDTMDYPKQALDMIIYHIFVDRFASAYDEPVLQNPGSLLDFFGGTLNGIVEKLDYLADLGVNCIWLSPICESPTYHGYNPSSYTRISARYGGNSALIRLIEAAHRRGIRIMMDFVANHTSDDHPIFQEAVQNPANSSRQWYSFGEEWPPNGYLSFFNVANMPQLRTDLPSVRRYLFDAVREWVGDWGVDAVRLDYVAGPSEDFWLHFQAEVKAVNPGAITLGEITGDFAEIDRYEGRLDGFMDFPLTKMLRQVFAQDQHTVAELVDYLIRRYNSLPVHMFGATSLDNHDMHRFLWLAMNDPARLALAAFCQMTLPGAPIIYYGTEVGLSQIDGPYGQDVYARMPMLWGEAQDSTLHALYSALIHLRTQYISLRRGSLQPLGVALETDTVSGYRRIFQNEQAIVVINTGETATNIPEILQRSEIPYAAIVYRMEDGALNTYAAASDAMLVPARGGIVIIQTSDTSSEA